MIGTVLTYEHTGIRGAGGQTVGADGSGQYAVVFLGDNAEETEIAARSYIKCWLQKPYVKHIHLVSASETYSGIPLQVVQI